ncbi:major facilitator superfamily domain-containing protein [Dactylonectria macrodidyma]|uniref:Major facilitator superfamily domain-containing protein n=1 Tax=Dactylonectria macrodidyma TaxID=307937 RepID=A0A9P9E0L6_9HYPO|nr:major facilitator superfamily domain-containing protein [Dactylonectria macrodidyma]
MTSEKMRNLSSSNGEPLPKDGEVLSLRDFDAAMEEGSGGTHNNRKVLKKIDQFLMPLLLVSYMLQFLDKQSLNFASIMGIIDDLNLVGSRYSWCSSVFYFGYLAFSYPASFLMVRLPLGKYLAGTSLAWAIILVCHAAVQDFKGLLIVRFFLGAAEASISPGFSLITGMWYKREEQPLRHGIWFLGNAIATMFGGLLAFGISHIGGTFDTWRWLFIIFGLITLVWAVVLVIFLPDTPEKARFLDETQRIEAVDRIRSNHTGMKSNIFKWEQVREVVTDRNVLLLMLFQFTFSIPNGAHTTFSSLVMAGFGFTRFQVYLLNMPMGAILAFFLIVSSYLCSRFNGYRTIVGSSLSLISLVGSILVRYGPNQGSRLFGLWLFVAFAAGFPICLSMISSNVAGFTKKSVASAMMFMAYTAGNIIGPFLFFPREAPEYASGFLATTICFGIATVTMLVLRVSLIMENRRRDRLQESSASTQYQQDDEISDETDGKNMNFRYVY